MKNLDQKTTIDLIIGIAGLVLLKFFGSVFGAAVVVAAGGWLCWRTKKVYTYPLITLVFNFICSIISVVSISSSIDTWLEKIKLDALANLAAEFGAWAITAALSIGMMLYCGFVFLLMIICNFIVKKQGGF